MRREPSFSRPVRGDLVRVQPGGRCEELPNTAGTAIVPVFLPTAITSCMWSRTGSDERNGCMCRRSTSSTQPPAAARPDQRGCSCRSSRNRAAASCCSSARTGFRSALRQPLAGAVGEPVVVAEERVVHLRRRRRSRLPWTSTARWCTWPTASHAASWCGTTARARNSRQAVAAREHGLAAVSLAPGGQRVAFARRARQRRVAKPPGSANANQETRVAMSWVEAGLVRHGRRTAGAWPSPHLRTPGWKLFIKTSDGGPEQPVQESTDAAARVGLVARTTAGSYTRNPTRRPGPDIWAVPVPGAPGGDGKPVVLVATPGVESQGQISPDGRWIAYTAQRLGAAARLPAAVRGSNDGRIRCGSSRR